LWGKVRSRIGVMGMITTKSNETRVDAELFLQRLGSIEEEVGKQKDNERRNSIRHVWWEIKNSLFFFF
jgi:hypothetical protein